jgi:hypothetical protein
MDSGSEWAIGGCAGSGGERRRRRWGWGDGGHPWTTRVSPLAAGYLGSVVKVPAARGRDGKIHPRRGVNGSRRRGSTAPPRPLRRGLWHPLESRIHLFPPSLSLSPFPKSFTRACPTMEWAPAHLAAPSRQKHPSNPSQCPPIQSPLPPSSPHTLQSRLEPFQFPFSFPFPLPGLRSALLLLHHSGLQHPLVFIFKPKMIFLSPLTAHRAARSTLPHTHPQSCRLRPRPRHQSTEPARMGCMQAMVCSSLISLNMDGSSVGRALAPPHSALTRIESQYAMLHPPEGWMFDFL